MPNERAQCLRKMLDQVDPSRKSGKLQESLENAVGGHRAGLRLDVHDAGFATNSEARIAQESLDALDRASELDDQNLFALEAIVMPFYRPVVDIVDNSMVVSQLTSNWKHLGQAATRVRLEKTFLSIGRLEIPGHPSLPYAGTGFVVGKLDETRALLMTNRHVAAFFSTGIGTRDLDFVAGQTVSIDFLREYGRVLSDSLKVRRVVMVHPYWDMALLEVTGLRSDRKPLTLRTESPECFSDCEVVVIGYPGYDPAPDIVYQQTQARIFRNVYYVKRLQPGFLRVRNQVKSYNHVVPAIIHDSSTVGGNSGSPVIDVKSGDVIALHFAGSYLRANFAVPAHDLAQDSRVVDAGVRFSSWIEPEPERYEQHWKVTDQEPRA